MRRPVLAVLVAAGVLALLPLAPQARTHRLLAPTVSPTLSATPSPAATPCGTHPPSVGPTLASTRGSTATTGPAGSWVKVWGDEFDGATLSNRWVALDGYHTNNVTTRAANVTVTGGHLVLTRSDASTGAEVDSATYDGAERGFELQVGDYAEARVLFPGNGTQLYNWPSWWASGPDHPAAGEHDIAEGLGGDLTVNYHSPSGAHNQGSIAGYWGGAFHTYGLHRGTASADVYWDGRLVCSYATDDNGRGEALLLNVGTRNGPDRYGAAGAVRVDWVHVWRPDVA